MKKSPIKTKVLNRIMKESKYALFEVCLKHFPKLNPFIVEAHAADEKQFIWCSCEEFSVPHTDSHNLPVILKFINRRRGNFIQVHGSAFVNERKHAEEFQSLASVNPLHALIQVKVHQVAWFDKKSGEVEFFA